jgi:molybdopterin molybdotransferase
MAIMKKARLIVKTEYIEIDSCVGRILAEDVKSKINVPPSDNSAVDGYGFNYLNSLKNKSLKIIGSSKPGEPFLQKLMPNTTVRVFTGAPLLKNKSSCNIDTVIMTEDCIIVGDKVFFKRLLKKGSNIRLKSEDIRKGNIIMSKGIKIRPYDVGYLASVGIKKLKVYKKINVGVFSTGNEIKKEGIKKNDFKIFDSNKLNLLSLLDRIGCHVQDLGIIKDDLNQTHKKLLESTNNCDLIITSGGVAASETDQIIKTINEIGEIFVWKLAIKPGRPIAFGKIKSKFFFGLPGNPVAVLVTFFMIIVDFIYTISGRTKLPIKYNLLESNFNFKKKIGRTEWLRGSIKEYKNKLKVSKFNNEGSGILTSIAKTDGIIELNEKTEFVTKGEMLKFYKYEDFLN